MDKDDMRARSCIGASKRSMLRGDRPRAVGKVVGRRRINGTVRFDIIFACM